MYKFDAEKKSTQEVPWTKSVSRGEKIMYKFHEQKWARDKLNGQKSACNKFYEKNQFHDEENKFTSFTKRKNQHSTCFTNKN